MTSFSRYLTDSTQRDTEDKRWLAGPRISADQLKEGVGPIQHLPPEEIFPGAKSAGLSGGCAPSPAARPAIAAAKPTKAPPTAATCWFGKHKGRLLIDLREEEPGYWDWACREVRGFREHAGKLGLLDGDPDDSDDSDQDDGDAMTVNR